MNKFRCISLTVVTLAVMAALMGLVVADENIADATQSSASLEGDWNYANSNLLFVPISNRGTIGPDCEIFTPYTCMRGIYYPYAELEPIETGENRFGVADLVTLVTSAVDSASGDTLATWAEYGSDWAPGPIIGGAAAPDAYTNDRYRVYKLHGDSLETNPNQDYLDWPDDLGAPLDGEGNPAMIDGADQMLWTIFNDLDAASRTHYAGSVEGLGLEVHQTIWAYADGGRLAMPTIAVTHVGPSLGTVSVAQANPFAPTEHDYAVVFQADPTYDIVWAVKDLTTDEFKTSFRPFQEALGAGLDGMSIAIDDPGYLGIKPGNPDTDPGNPDSWGWDVPNGTLRFTWEWAHDFGFEAFHGALTWGGPSSDNAYGSYPRPPANGLPRVLLKLADVDSLGNFDTNNENVSYAYRWLRRGGAAVRPEFAPFIIHPDSGDFGYQDFTKSCPLSAWDISENPPRRLAVGYFENNKSLATLDGKYFPPSLDSLEAMGVTMMNHEGPYEWLVIFSTDYSEIANAAYTGNARDNDIPVIYWATWARADGHVGFETGDEFEIIPGDGYSSTVADTFYFSAPAPVEKPSPNATSLYVKNLIKNKGTKTLLNLRIGCMAQPWIGSYMGDLIGCDTLYDRAYAYNSGDDPTFGSAPPAFGMKVEEGPIVPSAGDTATVDGRPVPDYRNLGMVSFVGDLGIDDPDSFRRVYYQMNGLDNLAHPYVFNDDTLVYKYSGDPVTGQGDLDRPYSNKWMMATTGGITLRPGDSMQIVWKLAVGQGDDPLSSLTALREVLEYQPEVTAADDNNGDKPLPTTYSLGQNYPNPFNPTTTIKYTLPEKSHARIDIFNLLGQRVATLVNETVPAGEHTVVWNGADDAGARVASGVYFYRLIAGEQTMSRKMMLLK